MNVGCYSDQTLFDKSALKRWVHRRRFSSALHLAGTRFRSVLDFGGGSGELCKLVAARAPQSQIICYEPSSSMFKEATENLAGLPNVRVVANVASVPAHSVDVVFCLEVFEHLQTSYIGPTLDEIASLMHRRDGVAIIGVPIEVGPPAIPKGIFRMTRRYGEHDGTPRNILLAAIGSPPSQRPTGNLDGIIVHPYHLGFDHRRLHTLLQERFKVEQVLASPFQGLGWWMNSEIYFRVRLAGSTA